MPVAEATARTVSKATKRFYRPELDALRFFAFLAVLIHHGPGSPGLPNLVSRMGGFGLSMFFLLSAYLITELLVREREETETVAWKLFFTRRALRIWPLYYAAVLSAFVIGRIVGNHTFMSATGLAGMAFFVVNWFHLQMGTIVGPLWSISVEEQFYAVWPPVVKFGGKKFAYWAAGAFVAGSIAWIGIFSARGWRLWYDTPVEFVFFAGGVLIALMTHGAEPKRTGALVRLALLAGGLAFLALAVQAGGVGTDDVQGINASRAYIGFGGAMVGCGLIFYSVMGLNKFPQALIYLGKISYGLYVFHAGILGIVEKLTKRLESHVPSFPYMLLVDLLALALTIAAAHLSYQYFEKPFLKMKERFEVVRSRPA